MRWLITVLLCSTLQLIYAQSSEPKSSPSDKATVTVDDIFYSGNRITRDRIIARELDILLGDTIRLSDMATRIIENEKRVLNTGLFNKVDINIRQWDTTRGVVTFEVAVIENWYIYPAPILEFADRNFNVWWTEQGRDLSRIDYGIRASHINLTGHRDKLKLVTQFGYTRKYEIEYSYPYLNDAQTIGVAGNIFYADNKEIHLSTVGNKPDFFRTPDDDILRQRLRLRAWVDYRNGLYSFHRLRMSYHDNRISDLVSDQLNPAYFLDGRRRQRYVDLLYQYRYDQRVFLLYPYAGYALGASVQKQGIGLFDDIDNLSVSAELEKYIPIAKKWIIAMRVKGKTNLTRQQQPFANNQALGYDEDIISGYDLYVIDGTDYLLSQNVARFKIYDKLLDFGHLMPIKAFKLLSLQIFLNFNFDIGYVREPDYQMGNPLANRWISGYGPGIDFIFYNNFLFQIEYNFNQLGEKGLFLHNTISF